MLTVLFSRFFYIPGYLSDLEVIARIDPEHIGILKTLGDSVLAVALILGAVTVLTSLTRGIAEHRKATSSAQLAESMAALAPATGSLEPAGRFERILLATDGSEYSEGAINVAISMAQRCQAKVFVAGIAVYNPEYASTVPELEAEAIKRAHKNVERAVSAVAAAGLDYEIVIEEAEEPWRGICDAAEEYRVDVIVMGRRGKRGLARNMIGDATAKVIGHAPCSVIVAPRSAKSLDHGMLVATDGSRYGDAAAWSAGRIALTTKLPLAVVSAVMTSHSEERRREAVNTVERVKQSLSAQGVEVRGIIAEGRPEQVIVDQARHLTAGLIIIGTHGRTGLERLLMGSIAERVIGFAECPVLAVKG